mmetsp:Transcript_35055/g.69271  ORF Transcript_35055/g.69271 Transcript_35055/m.69271 type:complete len:252 (-) Transcript_35055:329-1084(-)
MSWLTKQATGVIISHVATRCSAQSLLLTQKGGSCCKPSFSAASKSRKGAYLLPPKSRSPSCPASRARVRSLRLFKKSRVTPNAGDAKLVASEANVKTFMAGSIFSEFEGIDQQHKCVHQIFQDELDASSQRLEHCRFPLPDNIPGITSLSLCFTLLFFPKLSFLICPKTLQFLFMCKFCLHLFCITCHFCLTRLFCTFFQLFRFILILFSSQDVVIFCQVSLPPLSHVAVRVPFLYQPILDSTAATHHSTC